MPDQEQLELNKQQQKTEFKTEQAQTQEQAQLQIQSSLQAHAMQGQNVPAPVPQDKNERRSKKVVKKYGVLKKKEKEVEQVYGATKNEIEGEYSKERKYAFRQQLLDMTADHLKQDYNPEFTGVINMIREYAQIVPERENYLERGQKLTEARRKILDYINTRQALANLSETDPSSRSEKEALETIKMYELWFRTFSDGNLEEERPESAIIKEMVGDGNEPEIQKEHQSGSLESAYVDMSDQPLFAGEPSMEDIQQGFVADCYLIAGLISILAHDPMAIKSAMRDNGKTATVRFYEPVLDAEDKKIGVRPVYVTVNKSLPKIKRLNRETYLSGSLWAGIIEKAYVVWGGHLSRKAEKRQKEIKNEMIAKYVKGGMEAEEAEKKAERESNKEIQKIIRAEKPAYESIAGGVAFEFIEIFTGKEKEDLKYMQFDEKAETDKAIRDGALKTSQDEIDSLLSVTKENRSDEKLSKKLQDFAAEGEPDLVEKLLQLTEKEPGVVQKIKKITESTLKDLYQSILEKYYGYDKSDTSKYVDATRPIYLEDIQEEMEERINKSLYGFLGVSKRIRQEYGTVLNALVKRMLKRIEEEQDERLESGNPEEARAQFVHRTESRKYSKFAEKEFNDIKEKIEQGYYLNTGTVKFAGENKSGLNGETLRGGLMEGHAYTVLGTHEMDGMKFIKLRNPWAKGTLRYIRTVGPDGKETLSREMNLSDSTDGIFFLELNEFITKMTNLEVNKNIAPNIIKTKIEEN